MTTSVRSEHLRALGALIFGACVLGLASTLVRLSQAGPAATGFWRVTLALPWLLWLVSRSKAGQSHGPSRLALFAGVMFGIDIAFWHYGVMNTSLVNSNVLANLTPVVVTLIAWLVFKQRPRPAFIASLALAVGGAWILAQPGGDESTAGSESRALGDFLSAASCLWYAMYLLATGAARRTETTLKVMLWSAAAAAPTMFVIALLLNEPILPKGSVGWLACIGLGIIHVAGQGAISWALGRLEAATASIVVLVQPVVAALLGWLLFSESLPLLHAAGASLILAGIVLSQRSGR